MRPEQRSELIDAYFSAMDDERHDLFEKVLANDVVYQIGDNEMHGVNEVRSFFESGVMSNTNHNAARRIHGEWGSVCEGTYSAIVDGQGEVEGEFADIFEFNDNEERITRVSIYTR